MANTPQKDDLLEAAKAIHSSLDDAKVSRTLFKQKKEEENPGPILLRIYFKSFLYSMKEIMDYAKTFNIDSHTAPINYSINSLRSTNPIIHYVAEARNTFAHNPLSFLETNGGWEKVAQPEQNPDGTLNMPFKWIHKPGNLNICEVKDVKGMIVSLPDPNVTTFSNPDILAMMDSAIALFDNELNGIDQIIMQIP